MYRINNNGEMCPDPMGEGCVGTLYMTAEGQHICDECGMVAGNTYEPAWEEGRSADGPRGPGRSRLDPFGFNSRQGDWRRRARIDGQASGRQRMAFKTRIAEQIRFLPLSERGKNEGMMMLDRIPGDLLSKSRVDSRARGGGVLRTDAAPVRGDRGVRTEVRACEFAWAFALLVHGVRPINFWELAKGAGVETNVVEEISAELSTLLKKAGTSPDRILEGMPQTFAKKVENQFATIEVWLGGTGLGFDEVRRVMDAAMAIRQGFNDHPKMKQKSSKQQVVIATGGALVELGRRAVATELRDGSIVTGLGQMWREVLG